MLDGADETINTIGVLCTNERSECSTHTLFSLRKYANVYRKQHSIQLEFKGRTRMWKEATRFNIVSEHELKNDLEDRYGEENVALYRKGWPDFIVETPDEGVIVVECKQDGETLKRSQQDVMSWLSRLGADCYVYSPTYGLISFGHCRRVDKYRDAGKGPKYPKKRVQAAPNRDTS